jgi:hypothetical protein
LKECLYCQSLEETEELKTSTINTNTVIDGEEKLIARQETPPPQSKVISTDPQPVSSKQTVEEKPAKENIPIEEEIIFENEILVEKEISIEKKSAIKDSSLVKLVGWLVSYDIDPAGIDFKLYKGRTKIGRSKHCDIIVDDSTISEEHVLLSYKDGEFILQDELSANGTFLNGKQIEQRVFIKDGDELTLGSVNFIIKLI